MNVEEQVKNNTEAIQSIRHFLFGNGEPGWDEMLRKVYDWMQNQEKLDIYKKVNELYDWMLNEKDKQKNREKAREEERKFIRRSILAPLLTAIVLLIFNGVIFGFVWFFKLLPILDALQKQAEQVGG